MKMNFIGLIIVGLLLGSLLGSLTTYYLFPQIILREPEVETITFIIGHGYHYSVPIIMQHLGLLEKYSDGVNSIAVEAVSVPYPEFLISGTAQFAQRSGPALLNNIDDGAPIKMLASVGKKDHELWTNDPNINSLVDLTKDTKVNLVKPTSIESIGIKIGLQRLGKTLDDISPIYISHADAYQMMITGEIDCDFTAAPWTSRYAGEPDKYHLLETDTTVFNMELPASLLYATIDYVDKNPNIVAYVITSWYEAIAWIKENPENTSIVVSEFYGDPVDTAYQDWQDANMVFDPTFGLAGLATLSEILYGNGIISRAYEIDEILFPIALGAR